MVEVRQDRRGKELKEEPGVEWVGGGGGGGGGREESFQT